MMALASQERRLPHIRVWLFWISGLVATGLILVRVGAASPLDAYDDAFITFRYAQNLLAGYGFVYNPGQPVLGTTTPLFGLLLSILGLLHPSLTPAVAAHWLGALGWIAGAWAGMAWLRKLGNPEAALVLPLLIGLHGPLLSSLGMETGLLIGLMMIAAWAFQLESPWPAAVAAGLLILTRQDGALWVIFLGLARWHGSRRMPWREAAATVALTLPWFIYAQWQYGSILPNSALAKIGQMGAMETDAVDSFVAKFVTFFFQYEPGVFFIAGTGIALAAGIAAIVKWDRAAWWVPVWIGSYLAIYIWLDVVSFTWYYVPPAVGVLMVMALGMGRTLRLSLQAGKRSLRLGGGALLLALLLLMLVGANQQMAGSAQTRRAASDDLRRQGYRLAGEWLAQNAQPDQSVATIEIGIVGYFSGRPILDTMGLVSPEMAPFLTGWSDSLIAAITQWWPHYLITLPGTAWDGILGQDWFADAYSLAEQYGPVSLYALQSPPSAFYSVDQFAAYADGLSIERAHFDQRALTPGGRLKSWWEFRPKVSQARTYQFTTYLVDAQSGERFAQDTLWPFGWEEGYPVDHWPVESTTSLPLSIQVPEDISPGTYRVGLFIYDPAVDRGLVLADAPDATYPEVQLGYFRLGDPPVSTLSEGMTLHPLDAKWQEGLTLSAVGIPDQPMRPGDILPVYLDWQADPGTDRDLTVFLHVVNEAGEIVAQSDRKPFEGRFPTAVWRGDDALSDTMLVALPDTLASGTYSIRIGFYDNQGRLGRETGGDDSVLVNNLLTIQEFP